MDKAAKSRLTRAIGAATLVAGVLDLASAFVFSALNGGTPYRVMLTVAAGPFGDDMRDLGWLGVAIGTLVHFAIMSVMVDVLALASLRVPALLRRWFATGLVYGVILYLVMYWIVLPWRWPDIHPRTDLWTVGNALFSHVICAGLPMAYVLNRMMPGR